MRERHEYESDLHQNTVENLISITKIVAIHYYDFEKSVCIFEQNAQKCLENLFISAIFI